MKVYVRFAEPLWRSIGERRIELELPGVECSVADLVAGLEAAYPRFREEWGPHTLDPGDDPILGRFVVFVSDQLISGPELPGVVLRDGADVMLISPLAGG